MKKIFLLAFSIICFIGVKSQTTSNATVRYIEVTGSAELEIEPDEIVLLIGIGEYWEEEFQKGTEFKDYKTKVPIAGIEANLLKELAKLGIAKENIIIRDAGNYWRYKGKEALMQKEYELKLSDISKVNQIMNLNLRGIEYMRIGELKNKNITDYRQQVKIEALKAAKNKAAYLLSSIDETLGAVISIEEIIETNNFWKPQSIYSNSVMTTNNDSGIENIKKIKLKYEIKAKFQIE